MITLKDYLSFIYKEITDSRLALDQYVSAKAQEYAKDEIMKNFPVPRFRIPEMELNIPVLIAGAKYHSTIRFVAEKSLFEAFVYGTLNQAIQTLKIRVAKQTGTTGGGPIIKIPTKIDILKLNSLRPTTRSKSGERAAIDHISGLFEKLTENPIPIYPENIVKVYCENIFFDAIKENNIEANTIKPEHKVDELADQFETSILQKVKEHTIIVHNELQNLLVNPETQLVKLNSNEFSVFQVKAKINEEGVFIHTVKDEDGEKKIVEFE
ncbi:MAG: hypothetical protein IPM42_14720 [Saprospiraceae bacterium]|nr:hypothetical protein [Saprospiraceae bacterium]